jgi:GntR family transcriptional regulator
VHKHIEIREHLRALLSHEPPGTRAPSERELAEQFGVSRMTVRQAIDALVVEGVVERSRGRGTFVSRGWGSCQFVSFTEDMTRRGLRPESRTLLLRTERPVASVASALEMPPGATVVHWARVRYADGISMCVEDSYLPSALAPGLDRGSPPESLYAELGRLGLTPSRVEDSVEAGSCSEEESALLGIGAGDPVLRLARRTFAGRLPAVVSRSAYRADRYTVRYSLLRGAQD